ncbi:Crp/Fnr family transcriptional regulator [Variovorax sp. RHLX14]|uniref:Crp/Fnr family transcriptional regulator n=1 Tax=Variovorax sp. RHLX14 TaxID=1259731 RepID=UPI003F45D659
MAIISASDLLRRIPLCSSLTDKQLEEVSQGVSKERFKKDAFVVKQGFSSGGLHIFLNGRARVLRNNDRGKEVIISILNPGDYVGEMSLIDQMPHSASVRTEIESDVLTIKSITFARLMPEQSSSAHKILCMLVKRLRYADEQIESLALMDVNGRVVRMLLELAVDDEEGGLMIKNKFSQQDMAKMVGSSREMVAKAFKLLEVRKFIFTDTTGYLHLRPDIRSTF